MTTREFSIETHNRSEFVEITQKIQKIIHDSKTKNGICHIYVPHTTAGITINENADSSVAKDIVKELDKIIPFDDNYSHSEGNSAAHIKSSLAGNSVSVFIEDNEIKFGTWQGVFLCEFDGPRTRNVWVKIIED